MQTLIKRDRWILHTVLICVFFLLLSFAVTARVKVNEGEEYFTKREVSLYILTYKELPDNFYTKAEAENLFGSRIDAMILGYNIGGDTFYYYGAITAFTDNVDLVECDIYTNREELIEAGLRGEKRLVFTEDGDEVFYTRNHYDSFVRMTNFKIQIWSIVLYIVLSLYSILVLLFYWFLFSDNKLNKRVVFDDVKTLIYFLFMLPLIPFIYGCEVIIHKRRT